MGSIDKACIAGFLCRLCSEMHRTVIHIYGDQGKKHGLVEKINGYLPITISPTDPLPKTICETCLRRVEQHYDLLLRLKQYRNKRCNVIFKKQHFGNPLATLCRVPARTSIGVNTEDYTTQQQQQQQQQRTTTTSTSTTTTTTSSSTTTTTVHLEDDDIDDDTFSILDTTEDDQSSDNEDDENI